MSKVKPTLQRLTLKYDSTNHAQYTVILIESVIHLEIFYNSVLFCGNYPDCSFKSKTNLALLI